MPYKIHPAIGVARVGNAPTEFFFGPEAEDAIVESPGGFKDAECRVKRQAARFYVYEHDDAGNAVEVTDTLEIHWTFQPRSGKSGSGYKTFPDEVALDGKLAHVAFTMSVGSEPANEQVVPLGELRSDAAGRLIVLGGLGKTEPIPGVGSAPLTFSLGSQWYDDICEGPITATFTVDDVEHTLHAWLLVAPPRSSPHVPPSTSLYSALVAAATAEGWDVPAATPGTTHALDKGPLHFVAGEGGGDGIEASLSVTLAGYAANFEPSDPLRFKSTVTAPRMTYSLPNPWPIDILSCGWAIWDGSEFDDPEDARLNWPRVGILVQQGDELVLTERCDADLMITLLTPNVSFGQVPRYPMGMPGTSLRAIVFEVITTRPGVSFSFTTAPAGQFALEGPLPAAVGPTLGNVAVVRLWVRYTTTSVPPVGDPPVYPPDEMIAVVEAHAGASHVGTWSISLQAQTVERRVTATVLVLDRSGSMAEATAGGTLKHTALRDAAKAFLDLALDGDYVQLVRYDDEADAVPASDTPEGVSGSAVTALSSATRVALKDLVDGPAFNPAGTTSIGAGILVGRTRLATTPADPVSGQPTPTAMLVLTDGVENTDPFITDVASSVDSTTYAVGLGTPANTSAPALQSLAGNRGGYLLVTGPITDQNEFLLEKYFLQILAGINHADVIFDPDGVLHSQRETAIPFHICELDAGFEAILLTTDTKRVDFRLMSPAGRIVQPYLARDEPTLAFGISPRVSYYRVALPSELEPTLFEKEGTWHALLRIGAPNLSRPASREPSSRYPAPNPRLAAQREHLLASSGHARGARKGNVHYSFLVHTYSSLVLRASITQTSFEPGAKVSVRASLLDGGELPLRGARLKVEVARPGTASFVLRLRRVPGDPGHFEGGFVAGEPGVYACRVVARATTRGGHSASRERMLTAMVWHGGDRDAADSRGSAGAGRCACEVLSCLLGRHGLLKPELIEKLERAGIDLRALERCLAGSCRAKSEPAAISRELELAVSARRRT